MEEDDEIQAQACKFPRVGNGRNEPNKLGSSRGNDAEDGELRKRGGGGSDGGTNRFHTSTWHQSSRIVRVSRASGGKDRHSKVMTSKGLKDRRVRLSVTTAIQFYDLQDRLGYDQPSKAVEWLIKAASDAISELPSLNYTSFPDTPKQPSDEKRPSALVTDHQQGFDEVDGDNTNNNYHYQNQNQNQSQSQNFSLSKSACSSTSETSKGSGLSLSRSEIRVKARERARERAAKEKEKENESHIAHHHHQNVNPMSQTASFTELLTGGIGSTVTVPTTTTASPNGSVHQIHGGDETNLFNKPTAATTRQSQQWSSTVTPMVMDYFSSGLVMGPSSSRTTHQTSSGFSGQIQLGNNSLQVSPFSTENHSDQLQHFSFIPDHMIPAVVTSSNSQPSGISDCNLNFTISPSLAGYNRGTLQSNSPSHILPHHLQRFSSSIDGSNNLPFFMGGGAAAHPASAAPTMDTNHHQLQFTPVFDGRLQLCYGDGTRHSDQKGKAKN